MHFELSERTKDLQQRLTAFMEERCLPSAVMGPRDFAPLMREDSDFVSLDMGFSFLI